MTEKKPARKPAKKATQKKTTQKKQAKKASASKKAAPKAKSEPKASKGTKSKALNNEAPADKAIDSASEELASEAGKDASVPRGIDTEPLAADQRVTMTYVTRPADLDDVPAMVAIGNELDFFDPDNTDEAVEMLTQYFSGRLARHAWLVAELDAVVVGAAYFLPEPSTVGTWRLRFLGVSKQHQGQGGGQALLTKVEETLAMTKGRIVVETPATQDLQATQDFFTKHSYAEQARIQDFFDIGIDKIIQLKAL